MGYLVGPCEKVEAYCHRQWEATYGLLSSGVKSDLHSVIEEKKL